MKNKQRHDRRGDSVNTRSNSVSPHSKSVQGKSKPAQHQSKPSRHQSRPVHGHSKSVGSHPHHTHHSKHPRRSRSGRHRSDHRQPGRQPTHQQPDYRKKISSPPAEPPEGAFATLLNSLQHAVVDQGYRTPTPIQEQAIPHLLEGRDLLGCAQTGTGKTAAFALPILQYLINNRKRPVSGRPRVLILAPTRELAAQIDDSFTSYGKYTRIEHAVIFGGVGQNPQVQRLQKGIDILVATPGRLLDLMQQGHLKLGGIEIFVLDEADRMLDMGFLPDIRRVIAKLPTQRQSLFFSATMPSPVVKLAQTLVHDAAQITIDPEKLTVDKIDQKVMFVDRKNKDALQIALLRTPGFDKALVFTRMKHVANKVARKLSMAGIPAVAIHGNKSQTARTLALANFKTGKVRVLVATDIAARGIDVDNISHVVNYDLPNEPETYVHRIGRTARAGKDGDAISFCSADERDYLRDIEKLIRQPIPVDTDHEFHSETARNARGPDARPAPKQQRRTHMRGAAGRGRSGSSSRNRDRSPQQHQRRPTHHQRQRRSYH